jgi:hypothetical protein
MSTIQPKGEKERKGPRILGFKDSSDYYLNYHRRPQTMPDDPPSPKAMAGQAYPALYNQAFQAIG